MGTEIRFPVGEYILRLDGKKGGIKRVHRVQGPGTEMGFCFYPSYTCTTVRTEHSKDADG